MKNKCLKIVVVAIVLVGTLVAMIVPTMASESSGFVFVQFENPDHAEHVRYKSTDAFTYDSATGRVASTGLGTSDFYLSMSSALAPASGCYFFSVGLSADSPESALAFSFKYRYDGWECDLFTASNGVLKQSGNAVCDFTDGNRWYLTCFVDTYNRYAFYTVCDEMGESVKPYTMIDLNAIGKDSTEISNRLFYIYCSKKTSTDYCVFSDILVQEVPYTSMYAFYEQPIDDDGSYADGFTAGKDEGIEEGYQHGYIDGYDEGYSEGYDIGYPHGASDGKEEGYQEGHTDGYGEGYIIGYDDGHYEGALEGYANGRTDGLAEGYQNGLTDGYDNGYNVGLGERQDYWYDQGHIAGYDKGLKEYYNELYEKGLENIDENQGTGVQGFLAGMWNGTQGFMQELLDGITFSGLSLRSIVTTCLAIAMAAFLIRLLKG